MDGRWTLHVCKDCGQRAHYQDKCPKDRRRIWTEQVAIPVVPCDDAAVERAAKAARDAYHHAVDARLLKDLWPDVAKAVLRAAGEVSS